ncbi:unnamed protein product, partial [Discosporangium mesarthrocarpum]
GGGGSSGRGVSEYEMEQVRQWEEAVKGVGGTMGADGWKHGGSFGGPPGAGLRGFVGVSRSTQSQTSSPKSMRSSSDISCASWGHPVMVSPGSPNNISFGDRPPSFVPRVRLEAVRSPKVVGGGGGGVGLDERLFTSPDASKHVEQLHSPRSAFTPRSNSS